MQASSACQRGQPDRPHRAGLDPPDRDRLTAAHGIGNAMVGQAVPVRRLVANIPSRLTACRSRLWIRSMSWSNTLRTRGMIGVAEVDDAGLPVLLGFGGVVPGRPGRVARTEPARHGAAP